MPLPVATEIDRGLALHRERGKTLDLIAIADAAVSIYHETLVHVVPLRQLRGKQKGVLP